MIFCFSSALHHRREKNYEIVISGIGGNVGQKNSNNLSINGSTLCTVHMGTHDLYRAVWKSGLRLSRIYLR
jgi:hypothetical protein